ncbi:MULTISPECIES: glycyl-radical enzyme activating protein [Clostridium]|uniref:Glycyl-radical enzyme activating protein n=1 Tax=Clostridium lapidicellarium TaxID=3240931 RepID=A0ABV4DZI3_9CLOT
MKNVINYGEKGIVFNIQRFSVNDGPGIRTIVFLKGCPLRCKWCSNPESQSYSRELMFNSKNCIGCGKCKRVCKRGAIDYSSPYRVDRNKCVNCGNCAKVCYPGALVMSGEEKTVREVVSELKKDSIQFRRSGGGVTLSGGDPLTQPEFSLELLKACKSMGWSTAVETEAYVPADTIESVIPWVDVVLLDIKNIDTDKYLRYTGVNNDIILKNVKRISELGVRTITRVPVIPKFNADEKSIGKIAEFTRSLGTVDELHLLPYHKLGVNKYKCLGRKYELENMETPDREYMEKFKKIVESYGLKCNVGAR